MKKNLFYFVFFLLTALSVWTFSSSLVVSSVCAAEEEAEDSGFNFGDFGENDSDESEELNESEELDESEDFESDETESDSDSEDSSEDDPEASFLSGFSEEGDVSEGGLSDKKAGLSKAKANPIPFASNGKKAGDLAELTLHGVKYRFRWCPAGTFKMGSRMTEKGRSLDEKQMETVIPHGFWILETEVTLEMFASFVEAAKYVTDAERDGQGGYRVDVESGHILGLDPAANWRFVGYRQSKDFPVTNVTWYDARKFVEWIHSEISTHEDPADSKRQVLLPTETQWEYACRAGTDTTYSMGDRIMNLGGFANIREMNQNKALMKSDLFKRNPWSLPYGLPFKYAAPVGSLAPNAWGIFDTHGNVWEWCADGYADYENSVLPTQDAGQLEKWIGRIGPDVKNLKVMRGGGWNTNFADARSAARGSNMPSRRFVDLGFRFIILPMENESASEDEVEEDDGPSAADMLFGGDEDEDSEEESDEEFEEEEAEEDFGFGGDSDDEEDLEEEDSEEESEEEESEEDSEEDSGFGDDSDEEDESEEELEDDSEDDSEESTEEEDSFF